MEMSAFGVEDSRISKADRRRQGNSVVPAAVMGGAGGAGVGAAFSSKHVPAIKEAYRDARGLRNMATNTADEAKARAAYPAPPMPGRPASEQIATIKAAEQRSRQVGRRLIRVAGRNTAIGAGIGAGVGAGAMAVRNHTRRAGKQ